MRKMLSILSVIVMLLSLSGCSGEKKVTIYIPQSSKVYVREDGQSATTIEYEFEEGWQDKENFTVTYRYAVALTNQNDITMVYGDKCMTTGLKGTAKTTTHYDENGRVTREINEYEHVVNDMEKLETTYTYDENGRTLTQHSQTYYTNREEPVLQTITYTYKETEQGSEGWATVGHITERLFYDKEYRLVRQSQLVNGEETNYTEREYDGRGNQISVATYFNGELISKSLITYKAVQVSKETADRLPQFPRETGNLFGLFG